MYEAGLRKRVRGSDRQATTAEEQMIFEQGHLLTLYHGIQACLIQEIAPLVRVFH